MSKLTISGAKSAIIGTLQAKKQINYYIEF